MVFAIERSVRIRSSPVHSPRWKPSRFIFVRCRPGALWIVWFRNWNMLALTVSSHRSPFNKDHHISGYNLFVSAYHGFAQLGNEHVPFPRAYEELPIFTVSYHSVSIQDGNTLCIKLRTQLERNVFLPDTGLLYASNSLRLDRDAGPATYGHS